MKQGVESLGRIKLQGIALLFLAFVVGILAGAAGECLRATRDEPVRPFARGPGMFRPGELPPWYEELDLTPEQREKITEILKQTRPLTDSIMQEMLPRIRGVTDSVRAEIGSLLNPEQREKLDKLEERFRRLRRKFRRGGRPPIEPRMLRPNSP